MGTDEEVDVEPEKTARTAYRWTRGTVQFDEITWQLQVDGEVVPLERKPLEVLLLLFRNAGEVVTKGELLDAVWEGRRVVESTFTNAIGKLRRALGDEDQTIIATVTGIGYRLLGKVERKAIVRGAVSLQLQVGDNVPRRPGWRLLRALDAAERGEVWLARHAKTREQRVYKFSFDGSRLYALKREVTISRLLRESLGERPEFVHVSDWDFTDAPYFIESRFGGPCLEDWAQAQDGLDAVPLEERIELLAKIADAVALAHDVGVLHKDLKPANLLVEGEPGDWQPRLVDFGSGRVLEPERLEALGISRLGLTVAGAETDSLTGTVLYLAPELLTGQVPTVRSDIYALGIVLYQLCVGDFRRPMSSGWEDEIDDALLCEDIAAAANGNPDLRVASARELAQRLRSRRQRAARRAQDIAAAQQAALNERALAAARARRPWMLAGACLLAIGCGVAWYMYGMVAAANARAVREMQVAQAVNQFLNRDLLATANPVHGGRANISLIEAINRAEPAIETRFANDPQVAGTIHQTLGDAYYQLADYDKAGEQYARAAYLFGQAEGNSPEDVIVAQLNEIQALALSGNRTDAHQRMDALWPDVERLAASSPLLHVQALQARNLIRFASMSYVEAASDMEAAKALLAQIPDADPYVVSMVRRELYWAKTMAGKHSPSHEETHRQFVAELDEEEGEEALNTLRARQQWAGMQVQSGKGHEMEQVYINLVNDYGRVMGLDHDFTLRAILGLANVYTKLGQWQDSERQARVAYDGLNHRHGPESPHTLNAQNVLAVAELRLGHLESAQALLEAGAAHLETRDDNLSQIFLAAYRLNLIHLRLAQERIADARALLTTVQASAPEMILADSDFAGEMRFLDGKTKLAEGDHAGGRAQLEAGLELLRQRNRDEYWVIQEILRVVPGADAMPTPATAGP